MRVFIPTTSSNNVTTIIASLKFLYDPSRSPDENFSDIEVFRYDERYLQECGRAVQGNPEMQARLSAGQLHFPPERVNMDKDMLAAARDFKPDVIVFVSAWEGDFVPTDDTLIALNQIAPSIHLIFDSQDPPWYLGQEPRGNVHRFHAKKCFSLTVALDGSNHWPGHPTWQDAATKIGPAITLLTPVDPRYFMGPPSELPYKERPYAVAFAGNVGGWVRGAIAQRLQSHFGPKGMLGIKVRDDQPNSYKNYADFLRMSRVSINIPLTGSGASKHVKGRVVESGYAGCALLEWKNDATRQWLTPRYEMMEYETIEEMIEIAEWMAGHPTFCAEMAYALRSKMMYQHSPLAFWTQVFAGVGLDPFNRAPKAPAAEPIVVEHHVEPASLGAEGSEPYGDQPQIIINDTPVASDGAPLQ